MRTNRSVRFDFCGSAVLLAGRGDQVSFSTTVGGWVALLDKVWGLEGCGERLQK